MEAVAYKDFRSIKESWKGEALIIFIRWLTKRVGRQDAISRARISCLNHSIYAPILSFLFFIMTLTSYLHFIITSPQLSTGNRYDTLSIALLMIRDHLST